MSLGCYVETLGCQMNKADSERMMGLLAEIGYRQVRDAEKADLLLLNTCTIREGAADRASSLLGRWGQLKRQRPGTIVAMAGCLAQERGQELQRRLPQIDLVFGTHNLHRLPELVKEVRDTGRKKCELYREPPDEVPETPVIRQTKVTAWVNVILGCNFNCTYCIVPQVRGREVSRRPYAIRQELEALAAEGFKEVTLLGQNVTAYGHDLGSDLADLLVYLHDVPGIERIRFLTGHPYHVSERLIDTVAELPKVCEFFHVPMQAGDDKVLRRMARIYTYDSYRRMAERIRTAMPRATISSDFIVGFPGETQEQFLKTCRAVEEIGFDACMTAMYSPRKNTPGARWEADPDLKVPEDEKHERLRHLNALVTEVAERRARELYEGRREDILIEQESPRNPQMWTGRTRGHKVCNFPKTSGGEGPGDTVPVDITSVNPWALRGELVTSEVLAT